MSSIPFSAVRDESLRQIETLCSRLLPQGRRFGGWWKCKVPWRDDRTASLMVSFSSGRWRDWGRPGDDGTMIDLVMKLDGCTVMEAKDRVAALLGMSGDVEYKPTTQAVKSCRDCRWLWRRFTTGCEPGTFLVDVERFLCTRVVEPVNMEPMDLRYARNQRGECGKYGRLHEANKPSP